MNRRFEMQKLKLDPVYQLNVYVNAFQIIDSIDVLWDLRNEAFDWCLAENLGYFALDAVLKAFCQRSVELQEVDHETSNEPAQPTPSIKLPVCRVLGVIVTKNKGCYAIQRIRVNAGSTANIPRLFRSAGARA